MRLRSILLIAALPLVLMGQARRNTPPAETPAAAGSTPEQREAYIREHYTKAEYLVPMRTE